MLGGGLEPPCLAAYAPQTYVSAISPPERVRRVNGKSELVPRKCCLAGGFSFVLMLVLVLVIEGRPDRSRSRAGARARLRAETCFLRCFPGCDPQIQECRRM